MTQFQCAPCQKSFANQSQLTRHLSSSVHSTLKRHQCAHCSKLFYRRDSLTAHVNTQHTLKPRFKCDLCPKIFPSQYSYNLHKSVHQNVKPFKCPSCPKQFRYSQQFKQHQNRHLGIKPFQCDLCPKAFVCDSELKTHVNYHLGIKPFQCQFCDKRFSQDCHWKAHLRTHTGDKPYQCPQCPQKFTQKSHLNTHRSYHSGVKPYQCDICKERFRLPHTLKSHLRRHTGERPYKCKFCGKAFTQPSPLKIHVESAHSSELFQCDIGSCSKSFPSRSQLQVHRKSHLPRVNRFHCVFCGKGFLILSVMQRHIRGHIGEGSGCCEVCGEGGVEKGGQCGECRPPVISREVPEEPEKTEGTTEGDLNLKFQCKKCFLICRHYRHLNSHMKTHKIGRSRIGMGGKKKKGKKEVEASPPKLTAEVVLPKEAKVPVVNMVPVPAPPTSEEVKEEPGTEGDPGERKWEVVLKSGGKGKPPKKIYKCKICGMFMKHRNHLNGHMNVHKRRGQTVPATSKASPPVTPAKRVPKSPPPAPPPKPAVKTYPAAPARKSLGSGTTTETTRLKCKICKKTMSTQNQLNGHMNVHKIKKAYLAASHGSQRWQKAPAPQKTTEAAPIPPETPKPSLSAPVRLPPTPQMILLPAAPMASGMDESTPKRIGAVGPFKIKGEAPGGEGKLWQCKICLKIMRHQNQLNGHMNIHKRKKNRKNRRNRKTPTFSRDPLQFPLEADPLGDTALLSEEDDDMEIEYAGDNTDHLNPEPIPIPIVIPLEEPASEISPPSPPPGSPDLQIRIDSVRHVPVEETPNFRRFQCEHCNKMYKTKGDMDRHMEMHLVLASPPIRRSPVKKSPKKEAPSTPKVAPEIKAEDDDIVILDAKEDPFQDAPPAILEIFDDDDHGSDSDVMEVEIEKKVEVVKSEVVAPVPSKEEDQEVLSFLGPSESIVSISQIGPHVHIGNVEYVVVEGHTSLPPKLPAILNGRHPQSRKVTPEKKQVVHIPPPPQPSLRCHLCQRVFGNMGGFATHMKKHSRQLQEPQGNIKVEEVDPKKYKCILCSFLTNDKSLLTQHAQNVHYGANLHVCSFCKINFPDTEKLADHVLMSHTTIL